MGKITDLFSEEGRKKIRDDLLVLMIDGKDLRPEKLKNKKKSSKKKKEKDEGLLELPDATPEQIAEIAAQKAKWLREESKKTVAEKYGAPPDSEVLKAALAAKAKKEPCESEIAQKTAEEFCEHVECVKTHHRKARIMTMLNDWNKMEETQRRQLMKELLEKEGVDKFSAREAYFNKTGTLLEGAYWRGALKAEELVDVIAEDPHEGVRLAAVECTVTFVDTVLRKAYRKCTCPKAKARLSEIYAEKTGGRVLEDDVGDSSVSVG